MSHDLTRRRLLALGAAPPLAAFAAQAFASGPITLSRAWSRPAAAGQNAIGYVTIVNAGPADALIGAECALAGHVSLHESRMTGAVMSMRTLTEIPVPAHGQAVLGPGGLHLMLEHISRPFLAGQHIPVTLIFRGAGRIAANFAVQTAAPGGMAGMPGM